MSATANETKTHKRSEFGRNVRRMVNVKTFLVWKQKQRLQTPFTPYRRFWDRTMRTTVLKIEQKDTFATYFKCGIADKWFSVSYLVRIFSVMFYLRFFLQQWSILSLTEPHPCCVSAFSFEFHFAQYPFLCELVQCVCVCVARSFELLYFANKVIYILFCNKRAYKNYRSARFCLRICFTTRRKREREKKKANVCRTNSISRPMLCLQSLFFIAH